MTENEIIATETEEVEEVENAEVVNEEIKPVIGVVLNCPKLNIRKEPNTNADVVFVADNSTELVIDEFTSTEDWFSVCTDNGIEGFCMKKYIAII